MTEPILAEPTSTEPQPPRSRARRRTLLISAAAGAVIGLGAVYGIGGVLRNAGDPVCRPAVQLAKKLSPLITGEVAAIAAAQTGLRVPDIEFRDGTDTAKKLSDWRGRVVLLNLWATWCVPCRKEMPALDELQAKLGSDRFEVVAVNIDTRDPAKPKNWLSEAGIARLGYYHDSKAKAFQELKAVGRALGMPTSVLIDGNGCEIGTLSGPAEWASDDALKLIRAAIAG